MLPATQLETTITLQQRIPLDDLRGKEMESIKIYKWTHNTML